MNRQVNRALLRRLIRMYGAKGTITEAAKDFGVSRTLLEKLLMGTYKPQVKERTRALICDGLNVSEDELFPVVSATESKSAS